jgi:chromosome segregation ATPase
MSDKDFRHLDPIVPQRDEMPPRRSTATKKSYSDAPPFVDARPGKESVASGGIWRMISAVTFVVLLGVVWFSWHQSQLLADLGVRFDELKSRIESTDESLSQSGAALSVKLKDHSAELEKQWSEIKKLWGVSYDTNRKAIDTNKTAIATQSKTVAGLKVSVASLKKDVDKANQSIAGVNSNSLAVSAQIEEVNDKVAAVSSALARIEKQVKQQDGSLAQKVAEHDEAIRAIDTYRLQINEQLSQIRRQVGMP